MSEVLVIQNTSIEGPGYLGELLNNDGFVIHSVNAKYEKVGHLFQGPYKAVHVESNEQ
ncbi:MAG: hypothetical protein HYT44_00070, partial [Nitrosarchaeum sp.]|nr:hypothetical protein [Nitrosarchaeum sp.]